MNWLTTCPCLCLHACWPRWPCSPPHSPVLLLLLPPPPSILTKACLRRFPHPVASSLMSEMSDCIQNVVFVVVVNLKFLTFAWQLHYLTILKLDLNKCLEWIKCTCMIPSLPGSHQQGCCLLHFFFCCLIKIPTKKWRAFLLNGEQMVTWRAPVGAVIVSNGTECPHILSANLSMSQEKFYIRAIWWTICQLKVLTLK